MAEDNTKNTYLTLNGLKSVFKVIKNNFVKQSFLKTGSITNSDGSITDTYANSITEYVPIKSATGYDDILTKTEANNTNTGYVKQYEISTVGKTGNYNDLKNKPTIPDTSSFLTETQINNKIATTTATFEEDVSNIATEVEKKPNLKIFDLSSGYGISDFGLRSTYIIDEELTEENKDTYNYKSLILDIKQAYDENNNQIFCITDTNSDGIFYIMTYYKYDSENKIIEIYFAKTNTNFLAQQKQDYDSENYTSKQEQILSLTSCSQDFIGLIYDYDSKTNYYFTFENPYPTLSNIYQLLLNMLLSNDIKVVDYNDTENSSFPSSINYSNYLIKNLLLQMKNANILTTSQYNTIISNYQ